MENSQFLQLDGMIDVILSNVPHLQGESLILRDLQGRDKWP